MPCTEIGYEPGTAVLRLFGVLDTSQAAPLHESAVEAAAAGQKVVVSLEAVERLDAAALQILAALRKHLSRKGHGLECRGATEEISQYLSLSGYGYKVESK